MRTIILSIVAFLAGASVVAIARPAEQPDPAVAAFCRRFEAHVKPIVDDFRGNPEAVLALYTLRAGMCDK